MWQLFRPNLCEFLSRPAGPKSCLNRVSVRHYLMEIPHFLKLHHGGVLILRARFFLAVLVGKSLPILQLNIGSARRKLSSLTLTKNPSFRSDTM